MELLPKVLQNEREKTVFRIGKKRVRAKVKREMVHCLYFTPFSGDWSALLWAAG
jgi:hypothetical protein